MFYLSNDICFPHDKIPDSPSRLKYVWNMLEIIVTKGLNRQKVFDDKNPKQDGQNFL